MDPRTNPDALFVRRVARTAWGLVMVGVAAELILRQSLSGAASLTLAGGVSIINFRWLETVLQGVVQPGQPHFDLISLARIVGRFVLLAGVFAALLWVPHIEPVAIALGFSTLVVAIVIEGARWALVGGR
jgi:hypothetical protein